MAVAVVRAPYSLSKLGRTGLVIYWKERIVNPALEAIENDSIPLLAGLLYRVYKIKEIDSKRMEKRI